jgi:HEAT repeat protein
LAIARKHLLARRFGHTLGQKGGKPVYRIVVPFVVLMLLAGCKGGSSSKPKADSAPAGGTNGGSTNTSAQTSASSSQQAAKLYDGYTLDDWATLLMSHDSAESDTAKATMIKYKIGKEQVPYLVKAINSKKPHVKLNTLDILIEGQEWAKHEGKELVPLLKKALLDDAGKVRQKASDVIVVLRFPESVQDLRARAESEDDPAIKQAMKDNLAKIK